MAGPTPGIVCSRRASSPSSRLARCVSASVDLPLQEVVLVEQELHLEGDLVLELGHRDRCGGGRLQALGLRLPQAPVPGAGVGVREGRDPALPRHRRGGCHAQELPGGATGRVVEELAQLGEAELDEPDEALADAGLLGHERHREAAGLAQLDPIERVVGLAVILLGHEREGPRIGRVGLRPVQPALGKVLRPERVDHRDRHGAPSQVARERHPVVATRLHRDPSDRLVLPGEPGVESVEAGAVLADAQDLPLGLVHAFPAAGHRVLPAPDVDAHRHHRSSPSDTQGCPYHPVDVS